MYEFVLNLRVVICFRAEIHHLFTNVFVCEARMSLWKDVGNFGAGILWEVTKIAVGFLGLWVCLLFFFVCFYQHNLANAFYREPALEVQDNMQS